jgi:hypothetical protein
MSARINGLTAASFIPGPDLYLARDTEGKTTATRSFTCLSSAVGSAAIQARLKKGTPITFLCTDLPPEFAPLLVDESASQDAPGGFTTINVTFKGYVEEGEFGFDREINYSIRGTTFRRPIQEHPTFIKDMEEQDDAIKGGLVAILTGDAYAVLGSTGSRKIIRITPNEEIVGSGAWVSNEANDAWWDIIAVKGLRDYDAASLEWTRSTANASGLSDADIAQLAKSDTPPGGPPEPDEEGWWQMVDLSDERSSNSSSNSITWRFVYGEKIPKLHDYEDA